MKVELETGNAEPGTRNSEWMTVRLGDVVEIDRSSVDGSRLKSTDHYLGLEHLEGSGEIKWGETVKSSGVKSNKFSFTGNHVLFGKLRPYLRKIVRPDKDGVCSTDILPLLPKSGFDRDFIFHLLRTDDTIRRATQACSGANLPRLSPEKFRAFEFRVPRSPVEQKRIAAILDKADAIRRKRQQALRLTDDFLRSLFLDMFGDPVTNPKGWEQNISLGSIADIVSGITKGRKLNGQRVQNVPYLAVANVQDKRLALESVKSIDATDAEIERFQLSANDLLLTEGGDPDKLGRGTLWKGEIPVCIHQNHVFRVRLTDRRVDPVYLNWLVGSERGKKYFLRSAKQTTGIASINMTQLRAFPMLLPPIGLQRQFAGAVSKAERLVSMLSSQTANAASLFSTLQQRAFRGEL